MASREMGREMHSPEAQFKDQFNRQFNEWQIAQEQPEKQDRYDEMVNAAVKFVQSNNYPDMALSEVESSLNFNFPPDEAQQKQDMLESIKVQVGLDKKDSQ